MSSILVHHFQLLSHLPFYSFISCSGSIAVHRLVAVSPRAFPLSPDVNNQVNLLPFVASTSDWGISISCAAFVRCVVNPTPFTAETAIKELSPSNEILLLD